MNVDVYQIRLVANSDQLDMAKAVLAKEEFARFEKMAPPWRDRRIIARASLRYILGSYIGILPNEVSFSYDEYGKPSLIPEFSDVVSFNLAHSADLALIALSQGVPVGIDLEAIKEDVEHDLLTEYLFSSRELMIFRRLPAEQRRVAFFRAWTLKEAFVKATGEGMSRQLVTFDVDFEQEKTACLLTVPAEWASLPWTLSPLLIAPGFCGALAIGSHEMTVRLLDIPVLSGVERH